MPNATPSSHGGTRLLRVAPLHYLKLFINDLGLIYNQKSPIAFSKPNV
ncbi:hypothetical protein NUACC26_048430 [Scytonema sp. NUACC26]